MHSSGMRTARLRAATKCQYRGLYDVSSCLVPCSFQGICLKGSVCLQVVSASRDGGVYLQGWGCLAPEEGCLTMGLTTQSLGWTIRGGGGCLTMGQTNHISWERALHGPDTPPPTHTPYGYAGSLRGTCPASAQTSNWHSETQISSLELSPSCHHVAR